MSIDHGKVLAVVEEMTAPLVSYKFTPSQQAHITSWANKLRALAQPAEAPHCKGHAYFDDGCIDCSDALERQRKGQPAEAVEPNFLGIPIVSDPTVPDGCIELRYQHGGRPMTMRQCIEAEEPTDAAQGAVAFVPVHPKLGPLWGDTYPAGDAADGRSPHYERMPLFTRPQAAPAQGDGVSLIAAERRRQIDTEGWTTEHDDEHAAGELARAAGCYALAYALHQLGESREAVPAPWPWDHEWWKPTWDARQLVKAGALIAAEIDRLQRAAAPSPEVRADPGIEVGGTQHGPAPSQEGES